MIRRGKVIFFVATLLVSQFCGYGCSPAGKPKTLIDVETHAAVNVEINTLNPDEDGCIFISDDNDFPINLTAIELAIMNNLQDDITTGESYSVQVLKNGSWIDIPLDIAFNDPIIIIAPGSKRVFRCELYPEKYSYAPGKYRILKDVSVAGSVYTISIIFRLYE